MKIIDQNTNAFKRKKMIKNEPREPLPKLSYKAIRSSSSEVKLVEPPMSLDKRKLSDPIYASKYSKSIYELILEKEVG